MSLNFSEALQSIKEGHLVARTGWNGKGMYVGLHPVRATGKMDVPFLYIFNAQGEHVPWLPSQGDLLAEDWTIV